MATSLNAQQKKALQWAIEGKNVFVTGAAGTGKSFLLRSIVRVLQAKHACREGSVVVTAMSAVAAHHIDATTLHSGLGIGAFSIDQQLESLFPRTLFAHAFPDRPHNCQRWQNMRVLVIDEVSMLSAQLFTALELLGRVVNSTEDGISPKPFGGIQLILCGDFFQLPPVVGSNHSLRKDKVWLFLAETWFKCGIHVCNLQTVYRQRDHAFVKALSEIRCGQLSPETTQMLRKCVQGLPCEKQRGTPMLYPLNKQVEAENTKRLARLDSQPFKYHREDWHGRGNSESKRALQCLQKGCAETVTLKVGCKVMLLANMTRELFNGSIGIVVGFEVSAPHDIASIGEIPMGRPRPFPVVEFYVKGGKSLTVRTSYALKRTATFCGIPCSALHGSQGRRVTLIMLVLMFVDHDGVGLVEGLGR